LIVDKNLILILVLGLLKLIQQILY